MGNQQNRPRSAEELTEEELDSIVGGKEQLNGGQPDDGSMAVKDITTIVVSASK